MADQGSVEKLAFFFANRTFACKRLEKGLSRSASALSSFVREWLDPVATIDQCGQYVDDIGIAANNATDLTGNIWVLFEWNYRAGLKLTKKLAFRNLINLIPRQDHLTGRNVTAGSQKSQDSQQCEISQVRKSTAVYLEVVSSYENSIPRMVVKHTTNCSEQRHQST